MKKLSLLVLVAASAACTTTAQRTWRPTDPAAAPVAVTGTRSASGDTRILFDDQVVMEGSRNLSGTWQGKPVTAVCPRPVLPEGGSREWNDTSGGGSGQMFGADTAKPNNPTFIDPSIPEQDAPAPAGTPMCFVKVGDEKPFALFFRSGT